MAKRFLIVDDAVFMRMKLKVLLEQCGHEVVGEGGNGVEAVAKFNQLRPDVVLMDITMPEMTGIDALKEIMKQDSKAKIIMITAMGQEALVKEAVMNGAKGFVVKPFNEEHILQTIRQLIVA